MKSRQSLRGPQLREQVAQCAARIMIEGGISDYQLAKRKAVQQLRATDRSCLPNNEEIEAAISAHQRIFRAREQTQRLRELRRQALAAMDFLDAFHPRLVGPVLHGTADQHSDVHLHVFAEPAEELSLYLLEQGVPYKTTERRLRFAADEARFVPTCRFLAGDVTIELQVLPLSARRQAPLSPVDGRSMRRASAAEVAALTDASA
ncbi:MAG: hypothetical protein DRQ37_05080 [Gammaproteobacteria bacterium]|nr:MAG: hypothetical protein DRQ37_05080 [Gammaproteobacteria bacterium]